MAAELITKEDLREFRLQLLKDIRQIMELGSNGLAKQWLKNADVRRLLNISSNTIQRLRVSGKLHSSKVGGVHYYRYEDIEKLLNNEAA